MLSGHRALDTRSWRHTLTPRAATIGSFDLTSGAAGVAFFDARASGKLNELLVSSMGGDHRFPARPT